MKFYEYLIAEIWFSKFRYANITSDAVNHQRSLHRTTPAAVYKSIDQTNKLTAIQAEVEGSFWVETFLNRNHK